MADVEKETELVGNPELPIKSPGEDRLSRVEFSKRLTSALIDPTTEKATGVIGLVGEWGSGKSSVLNLVEEALRERYKKSSSDSL